MAAMSAPEEQPMAAMSAPEAQQREELNAFLGPSKYRDELRTGI